MIADEFPEAAKGAAIDDEADDDEDDDEADDDEYDEDVDVEAVLTPAMKKQLDEADKVRSSAAEPLPPPPPILAPRQWRTVRARAAPP